MRYYITCKDEENNPIVLLAKADSEEIAVEKVKSSYRIKEVVSVETKRPQLRKGTVSSSFTLLKDWGCVKVRRASRGGKSWPSIGE